MKPYRDVSIPPAARAMNLVRRHHSMPLEAEKFEKAASIEGRSAARNLRREARANHLRAKRRKMLFADIPEGEFPVLLQLSGGSNFVILKEKGKDGEFLVQFPDSREAVVDGERLEEVYDGVCVFLQPRSSRSDADSSGSGGKHLKKWFRAFRPTMETLKSLLFSSAIIGGALAYVHFQAGSTTALEQRSVTLPLLGILAAGFASLGLIQLRAAVMKDDRRALMSELACVPHFLVTALALSGWTIAPQLLFVCLVGAVLLASSRVGSMPSRFERHRVKIGCFAFLLGCLGTVPMVFSGQIAPEIMTVSVALGTYVSWLFLHADRTVQRLRLAVA